MNRFDLADSETPNPKNECMLSAGEPSVDNNLKHDLAHRFPELAATNEARKTMSWFLGKARADGGLDRDWQACKQRMKALNDRKNVLRLMPSEHDFWLCKRANPEPRPENYFLPFASDFQAWSLQVWQPPAQWWQWPTFDVAREGWIPDRELRTTRLMEDPAEALWQGNAETERSRALEILREIGADAPAAVEGVVAGQCAAWLDAALGRLGRLTQVGDGDIEPGILVEDLAEHVLARRAAATSTIESDFVVVADANVMRSDLMEDCLEKLYGSARKADGSGLVTESSPRGQSQEWRDYFRALGHDVSVEQALASVQLAALLLRSQSVWTALSMVRQAESDGASDLTDLATCVRRRWCLALRALAWLEISLQRASSFEILRPADLTCFAITSLLPLYPRALMAISHRGCDAKEKLIKSKAWGSNEVLLDATFRPEWQTNRAMVWSLFSPTPAICKLRSPRYTQSAWCRREAEMFKHLVETADFLDGRRYFEIALEDVDVVESAVRSSPATHRFFDSASGLESPPFEIRKWQAWQGVMVRAAAIAKFIHRFFAMAELEHQGGPVNLANRFLERLCEGASEVPEGSLLGFDHIWHRLAEGLRADADIVELKAPLARLPSSSDRNEPRETASEAEAWFERHASCVPVSKDGLDICDLLAALEWRDCLEGLLRGHNKGTVFENQAGFIDLRGVTQQQWMTDPGWTVARALVMLRLPYPLLIRQIADQGVESWPSIRQVDAPIFTQHHPDQVVPQSEVFFSLGGPWPAVYFKTACDALEMSPYLALACQESLKQGDDPVMMRPERGLSSLSIGGGSDFPEWLRKHQEEQNGKAD
jgi:hypothetical protein